MKLFFSRLLHFTKIFIKNIFVINTRASRWEYWGATWLGIPIFTFFAFFTLGFVGYFVDFLGNNIENIFIIWFFYVFIASFSCSIRRLHDIGKSGWNLLWTLIPLLGSLYLLYLDVQPSEQKTNAWGEVPKHTISKITQNEITDEENLDKPF